MSQYNDKTNVMRILDQKKIKYTPHFYLDMPSANGVEIANILNEDPIKVFKTLVTESGNKKYYVFMIPVEKELDLKKAAKAVGEKKIDMLKSKDLLPLTGYVHGGCSPIGMKKSFPTIIDKSAENLNNIFFSGGKIGYQVEITFTDFQKLINIKIYDVTV